MTDSVIDVKYNILKNCPIVKASLLLLVILGHSIAYWAGDWFTGDSTFRPMYLSVLLGWLGSFHVYGFVLVSGYIFAFKMESGRYQRYQDFIVRKVKRLIVPYIFVALIWVVPLSTILLQWDVDYIFKNFILCEGPSQLWFLWMLFDVFAIVRLIWKVISRSGFIGWTISLLLYGIGLVGYKYIPNFFCIWIALEYVIVFYVGIRIRQSSIINKIPWYLWIAFDLFLFWVSQSCSFVSGVLGSMLSITLSLLLHLVGAIMSFEVLQFFASKFKFNNNTIVTKFCESTMPIYLFHQQIIYLCIKVFKDLVPVCINITLNFFISIIAAYVIGRVLMQHKITRLLIGEM